MRPISYLPNVAQFQWPAGPEWHGVKVHLPVRGRLIHLRILPGRNVRGIGIQSIELRGASGSRQAWDFEVAAPAP